MKKTKKRPLVPIVEQVGVARPPNWVPFAFKLYTDVGFIGTETDCGRSIHKSAWKVCASAEDGKRLMVLLAKRQLVPSSEWSDEEEREVQAILKRGQDWLDAYPQGIPAQGEGWTARLSVEGSLLSRDVDHRGEQR
jgi:hypothetical protein